MSTHPERVEAAATGFEPGELATLRGDFPILSTRVHGDAPLAYLDNASTSQPPRRVLDRMREFVAAEYANVHRGIYSLSEQSTLRFEDARAQVGAFLGASDPAEIIFTKGATQSINLVARAWGDAFLSVGDEVLTTELEHHANIVPWQQLAARRGVSVRFAPPNARGMLDFEAFAALVTPRTRLVALTAASNVLGSRLPVAECAHMAHAVGARVLVDAAQAVPHESIRVDAWDADFIAFSGHKLLGPTGIGVLWARRELLQAMPPYEGGGGMIRSVSTDGFEPADPPARFEAGTPPIVQAIGLAAAIEYLQQVGLARIAAHERALTGEAHRRLRQLPGVHLFGPEPEEKVGIVAFSVDGIHAHDLAQTADSCGVAVRAGHHCAMPLHARLGVSATVRASFYLYNTMQEVERLAAAVELAQTKLLRRPKAMRAHPLERR